MQLEIKSNLPEVIAALHRKAAEAPKAVKKSLVDATNLLYTESLDQLAGLIYNRPIPTVKRWRRLKNLDGSWRSSAKAKKGQKSFFGFSHSGRQSEKKAWKRTSTLRRGERAYFDNLSAFQTKIDNATPYAQARHDLNRPSKTGYNNVAPWRKAAHDSKKDAAAATFRDVLQAQLEL